MTQEDVRELIVRRPDLLLHVYVVLYEDLYETQFGDGYYAYLHGAFLARDQAERFAAEQDLVRGTRVTGGSTQLGYAHHVIEVQLGIVDDEIELVSMGGRFDGASAQEVVSALAPLRV